MLSANQKNPRVFFCFFSLTRFIQHFLRSNSRWLWVNVNFFRAFRKRWNKKWRGKGMRELEKERQREREKEKLKSKPFTKKKNYELWKRQQQNCTCVWFEQMNSNSMKETKKIWKKKKKRFGTCNCARINRHKFSEQTNTQIHVRHIMHTTIHPIVIKSKQTTARLAANSITNNIWCASVGLLLKWLNIWSRAWHFKRAKQSRKKNVFCIFRNFLSFYFV